MKIISSILLILFCIGCSGASDWYHAQMEYQMKQAELQKDKPVFKVEVPVLQVKTTYTETDEKDDKITVIYNGPQEIKILQPYKNEWVEFAKSFLPVFAMSWFNYKIADRYADAQSEYLKYKSNILASNDNDVNSNSNSTSTSYSLGDNSNLNIGSTLSNDNDSTWSMENSKNDYKFNKELEYNETINTSLDYDEIFEYTNEFDINQQLDYNTESTTYPIILKE